LAEGASFKEKWARSTHTTPRRKQKNVKKIGTPGEGCWKKRQHVESAIQTSNGQRARKRAPAGAGGAATTKRRKSGGHETGNRD